MTLYVKRTSPGPPTYTSKLNGSTTFGGHRINEYFINYLKEETALGRDFVAKCKKDRPVAWLDLMRQFEEAKKGSGPSSKAPFFMQLSPSFADLFKAVRGKPLSEHLSGNKDLKISNVARRLELSKRKMHYFYASVMAEFGNELKMILGDSQDRMIDKVFLTGGLASSGHLQDTVKKIFFGKSVIIPENCNMCVSRGCLLQEDTSAVKIEK